MTTACSNSIPRRSRSRTYFDLDPSNGKGSDLGFELGLNGGTAFVPGRNGEAGFNTAITDYQFVVSGNNIEFRLANSLLNAPIPGLISYDNQEFGGEPVVLQLSQSGSYSVAGGASFCPNRLGAVTLVGGAVPEPATWALLILGFGAVGAALRRGRRAWRCPTAKPSDVSKDGAGPAGLAPFSLERDAAPDARGRQHAA